MKKHKLSATPWSRGLGKHYDDLVIAATTRELIDAGYLANFVAYAPSDPDLSAVSNRAGEFHPDELADAMDTPQITGDIVETWLKRGDNRPTLSFASTGTHAKHVAERFERGRRRGRIHRWGILPARTAKRIFVTL